jgi:D-3-phosphoglycerate dehydrogenase
LAANVLFVRFALLQGVIEDIAQRVAADSAAEVAWVDANNPVAWADQLAQADVLFASPNLQVTPALLDGAPRLRALVAISTGTDNIDVHAATARGIVVGHGPTTENVESMAEATMLLILALLYDLKGAERMMSGKGAGVRRVPRMLKGRTVGLLGFGRIAKALAHRLSGWGVRVLAYGRSGDLPQGIEPASLERLLAESDIVSVHLTLAAESRNLLDRRRLLQMKPGAFLINTARGGIVDETALHELVAGGHIGGIAFDVFETEPLAADSPLRRLGPAILTPHVLGHTKESIDALPAAAAANIVRALRGEAPLFVRNPEVLPAWRERFARLAPR